MREKVLFDIETEKAVLGAILLDNNVLFNNYLFSDLFFAKQNSIIFQTILSLKEKKAKADLLSVTTELKTSSLLKEAGGVEYVASLTNIVPTSANASYYINRISELWRKRKISDICKKGLSLLNEKSSDETLNEIENLIYKTSNTSAITNIYSSEELMTDFNEEEKYINETFGELRGIPSGFPTLDRILGGFQNGDMIVIGARPSIGKTAFALSMMENLISMEIPCGLISCEMSALQLTTRLVSQRTAISTMKLRSGGFSQEMLHQIGKATEYYGNKFFYVADTPNINLTNLKSVCRHMKMQNHVKIIFIDYIGLIRVDTPGASWEKITEISMTLKALARELQIPIVALSQLGREAEGNQPSLANIRGSGAIEQDADVVMFLNGERDLYADNCQIMELERDLIVAKHRNGPTGKVYLLFQKMFTKFIEDPNQIARAESERINQMSKKEKSKYFSSQEAS